VIWDQFLIQMSLTAFFNNSDPDNRKTRRGQNIKSFADADGA